MTSPWKADLNRTTDALGRIAVTLLRLSRSIGPLGVVPDIAMRILCGSEIPRSVPVGAGIHLPHGGRGVIVHPDSRLGSGVTLHVCTIGEGADGGVPTIGDHVYVGAGARIIGGITVGDGAKVGANAVVLRDVAPGSTVVGIPARPVIASK